jgi:hypothetical protein
MTDDEEELELDQFYSYMSDAENGLMECRNNNKEGICFFYLEGNDIILKRTPYFLLQNCIIYQVGLNVSEKIVMSKEFLEICAIDSGVKNPLD